jgi:transposase-like protein
MKCPKCQKEFQIQLGSKVIAKGCKILTALTAIVTTQCENCQAIFQVPITSKSIMNIRKKED